MGDVQIVKITRLVLPCIMIDLYISRSQYTEALITLYNSGVICTWHVQELTSSPKVGLRVFSFGCYGHAATASYIYMYTRGQRLSAVLRASSRPQTCV